MRRPDVEESGGTAVPKKPTKGTSCGLKPESIFTTYFMSVMCNMNTLGDFIE